MIAFAALYVSDLGAGTQVFYLLATVFLGFAAFALAAFALRRSPAAVGASRWVSCCR